jgi:hypothetical protein
VDDMGLLKKLFGVSNVQAPPAEIEVVILEGDDDLDVVGESYRQDALWKIVGGKTSERVRKETIGYLVPEPTNVYDPNAIGVWIQGLQVGFIAKELAREIIDDLHALIESNAGKYIGLRGVVAGGGERDDGPGMLGVFLEFPSDKFGLGIQKSVKSDTGSFTMSTGETDAFVTDAQDDSYDLSWMNQLSGDPSKRIVGLKDVLEKNLEPISRHFAFAHLEEIYYQYKEVFPDALKQFDELAEKHHAELETTIRAAMINKWGKLPNLVVYKKSAIRHSKYKEFEKALAWAEKGLAVYGTDAFKEEWTLDLQKRVVTLKARIEKLKSNKKD